MAWRGRSRGSVGVLEANNLSRFPNEDEGYAHAADSRHRDPSFPFNDADNPISLSYGTKTAGTLVPGIDKKYDPDSAGKRSKPTGSTSIVLENQTPLKLAQDDDIEEKAAETSSMESETSLTPIHAVFNGNNPHNVTVHLSLPVVDDIETELEEFSILRRLGDFKAARSYFKEKLGDYRKVPYVFVQYAQMLLDAEDFKALSKLRPEAVFRRECLQGPGTI